MPRTTIISIVDDDEAVREALRSLMRSLTFAVEVFQSAEDFLASPNVAKTSCLILDIHMPGMTGVELYSRMVELGYAIPTILITAYPDDSVRARALAAGVVCYLGKPFDDSALLEGIHTALGRVSQADG